MSLLAYNLTALNRIFQTPGGRYLASLPASVAAGVRGPAVDITTPFRGLSPTDYAIFEAQRVAGVVDFEWTGQAPDYDTTPMRAGTALYGAIVPATCGSGDLPGKAVYVSGPAVNQRMQVATADPNNPAKMPAIGILLAKLSATSCLVQMSGIAAGIYSGLVPQATYYVAIGGGLSSSLPPPGAVVQIIGVAVDSASLTIVGAGGLAAGGVAADDLIDGPDRDAYRETLPAADPFPTSITWWTDAGKTKRIVDLTITRNANQTPATMRWRVYLVDGVTVQRTVTDTIAYSGIFEINRTRVAA